MDWRIPSRPSHFIYEKFRAWTDNHGNPEDALCSTRCSTTSLCIGLRTPQRPRRASTGRMPASPVSTPALSNFRWRPAFSLRRSTARQRPAEAHWPNYLLNELDRGGHCAFEQPALFPMSSARRSSVQLAGLTRTRSIRWVAVSEPPATIIEENDNVQYRNVAREKPAGNLRRGDGPPPLQSQRRYLLRTPYWTARYSGPERDRAARGKIRATHPTFKYTPISPAEDLHGQAGRVKWVAGAPGEPPSYAGTDFIVAHEGRISAIYMFFDGERDPTSPAIPAR